MQNDSEEVCLRASEPTCSQVNNPPPMSRDGCSLRPEEEIHQSRALGYPLPTIAAFRFLGTASVHLSSKIFMSTQPPQRTPEERKRFMENLAAETPDEAFDPQALLEQLHFFTDPATRDLTQHPPGVQEWLDKNAALAFKPENLTKIFKGATELEIQDRALKENVSFAEAGKRTLAADFEGDMNVLLASEGYLGRPEPAMVGDMGPAQFLPFNEMAGDSAPHLYNIIAFAISADPAELAQARRLPLLCASLCELYN